MNLNLYGFGGQWLMLDCGVTFGDATTPGVDVIMPDPSFIVERKDQLAGLVLTHGHEDHIGAVAHLWPQLRCPLYATPFTAALLRRKLEEAGLDGVAKITEIPMSGAFEVGLFEVELITLTHSIPEPSAVVIRTGAGTILHTGDWKLDPDPLIGDLADEAALRRLGDEGVLAMIGDSTNALVEGDSGSEAAVRDSLMEMVGGFKNRVVFACFASNIARVQTIAEVGAAHDRSVILVGRSLWRITEAARETGYLSGLPAFITEHDAAYVPRERQLLICTGSQGEPRAALARIARGDHPRISLEEGDVAVFSSRVIPGNEKSIGAMQNQLLGLGVELVTSQSHFVHVSGHPARDELISMYQWVRPKIAVPVHGEIRHLLGHAELAQACQVPYAPVVTNGDVLKLAPGEPEIVGQVKSGRLALDGTRLVALSGEGIRSRQRMLWHGSAVLTLVVDLAGDLVADPQLSAPGLLGNGNGDLALLEDAIGDVCDAVEELSAKSLRDDKTVKDVAYRAVRRFFRVELGKKPAVEVHLVRLHEGA
ncbi:MAG: ribonuclease J [Alphaproteobacteria bacterium]